MQIYTAGASQGFQTNGVFTIKQWGRPYKACKCSFNSLPNDKIVGLSKLKAFADDNSNVAQMVEIFR